MCKRRSKETTPITPQIPALPPADPEIDALVEKMGLRPDTRSPEEITKQRRDEAFQISISKKI